ncbi:MAG: FtsX-like permease family protein, partial [Bacteroidota bacterium]
EFEETVNKTIASITKSPDFVIRHLDNERVEESRSTWIPMVALVVISSFLIVNIALGLFGVLWYNISRRRAEIGLRRALGASQGNIIQQFMGEILLITSLGMILGLFFAIQFPLLKVFEIPASNFYFAMLSAAGIILAIVGLCTFYPSYQASLTHPSTALHEE